MLISLEIYGVAMNMAVVLVNFYILQTEVQLLTNHMFYPSNWQNQSDAQVSYSSYSGVHHLPFIPGD